jgi:hypothetical protein
VLPNPDFNVLAGEQRFAEWLSAFECGLAVGAALLAAVDGNSRRLECRWGCRLGVE